MPLCGSSILGGCQTVDGLALPCGVAAVCQEVSFMKKFLFSLGVVVLGWLPQTALAQATAGPGPLEAAVSRQDGTVGPAASVLGCATADGCGSACCGDGSHRSFRSDGGFPGFIGPISNPVLSKDPRALTEARLLFIHDNIPSEHPLAGGNFQVYAMQVRIALTERLSLIADKDGYAVIHPGAGGNLDGWLNINTGLKYAFIRDVERQFLVTGGLMFEPQTGESEVFQGHGDGVMTVFLTSGKEIAAHWHLLGTFGYQFPMDSAENSAFYYLGLHLDREIGGWFYPLIELNWFNYTGGGRRGLPPALGEGDGLLNLGTSGVAGNNLVTFAVGAKAMLSDHLETGVAWEFPLSNRNDLLDNRLLVELILRY
jgi:hypothetical protein